MAKKRATRKTAKKKSRQTKGGRAAQASRGRSDDFRPDDDLSERWKTHRMGTDLPEGNYAGPITSCKLGQHFNADCFIIGVKLTNPADMKGQDCEIPLRLKTDVDLAIFGDALTILGYDPAEVDASQFSELARELAASGDTIHFQTTKSEGRDGRVFTNYRLSKQPAE